MCHVGVETQSLTTEEDMNLTPSIWLISPYPVGYLLGVALRLALKALPDPMAAGIMDGFCFDHFEKVEEK